MKIDLDSLERRMLITALTMKEGNFRDKMREPQTPKAYRMVRDRLLLKLAKDEMLHEEMQESVGGEKKVEIPH